MEITVDVTLLGAGRQAREIAALVEATGGRVTAVHVEGGFPTEPFARAAPGEADPCLRAVGAPAVSRALSTSAPAELAATYVHPRAWVADTADLGTGGIIFPHASVGHAVTLGDCVLVNYGVSLSHDVAAGRHATFAPGAHVAGGVVLGDGVFVGVGASITNDVRVGEGAVIGAGSMVVRDVPPHTVVVGVPARPRRTLETWLDRI